MTAMEAARRPRRSSQEILLLEEQIQRINRFPDQNPNPVMRMTDDGELTYANPASRPIAAELGVTVGDELPAEFLSAVRSAMADPSAPPVELTADHRTYAILAVAVPEFGFVNLYGTDVTGEKVVARFPDQNPNPVFRLTREGFLSYANEASGPIVRGLGLAVDEALPEALREQVLAAADGQRGETLEIESEDRTFLLKPVWVREFDFINVYGTDITDSRELVKAHREIESLLLNILPEPVARRLRQGERVIADRFDDVTLLFADIVGFTQLSNGLAAADLVAILNQVFSAFDELVQRHGLEKIKTIGDAYMVVGGLPERMDDHLARVADMALELRDELARATSATGAEIHFRIGMHCGPVVAGVIGVTKFIYDVWGDTVNTASRMESTGLPDRIQVTEQVHERLRDRFAFEGRGLIDVKGKGPMLTYFLLGRAEPLGRPGRPGSRARPRTRPTARA